MSRKKNTPKGLSSKKKKRSVPRFTFRMMTEAEAKAHRDYYKKVQQLFDFSEIDQLVIPGYVIAFFEYVATGEGMTRGVFLTYACSTVQLRRSLINVWGSHFAQGCEMRSGLTPLPGYDALIPEQTQSVLKKIRAGVDIPRSFSYSSILHANY